MPITKISKTFERKISFDYQTWLFRTELEKTVEINSKEELVEESDKLFAAARALTNRDIERCKEEIKPQEVEQK